MATTSDYRLEVIGDTPVAYVPLDEASSPVELKTGAILTEYNTPTGATDYASGWTFDSASSEYLFVGTESLDDVPGWIAANAGQFSLEAWIKKPSPTSSGASRPVRWGWYGLFIQVYEFNGQPDGYITCGFLDSGGTERNVEHYGAYFDNTYKHVVVTHDGTSLKLYVNGTNVATQTRSYEAYISGTAAQDGLGIGRDGPFNQSYFKGSVDDVAIYNYPLTSAQITAHYGASKTSYVGDEPAIQDPAGPAPRQPPQGTASSFHATWYTAEGPFKEVSVDLTVTNHPDTAVADIYFWALQASFMAGATYKGGGHTGLQYNPAYPNDHAVNWGGYDEVDAILSGSVSGFPCTATPSNDNTRDYDWATGETYTLRIWIPSTGTIRASINGVTIRDLYDTGVDRISGIVMWSEVFAQCSDASASISWSNMQGIDLSDVVWTEDTFELTYQSEAADGCLNTNTYVAGRSIRQVTNTTRVNAQYDIIVLEDPPVVDTVGVGFIPIYGG